MCKSYGYEIRVTYNAADQKMRDNAIAAYQAADERALGLLKQALKRLPHDGGLLICEAGARLAAQQTGALDNLTTILRQAPDWVDGHTALARFRFEQADANYLSEIEAALQIVPCHFQLWQVYMEFLADGGRAERAADVAAELISRHGTSKEIMLLEARFAGLAGDWNRADMIFGHLPDNWPAKAPDEARHRLRVGDLQHADTQLEIARKAEPEDVTNWAMTEICWRSANDERHHWLIPGGTEPVQLNIGLSSQELDDLAALLRRWHVSKSRPLSQSVRDGTQTRGNLFLRRTRKYRSSSSAFNPPLMNINRLGRTRNRNTLC